MNLVELFRSLSLPQDSSRKVLNAVQISEYPAFRIAINNDGNPVLLISALDTTKNTSIKNRRLKYLLLEQDKECKISENGKTSFQTFTLITFISSKRELHQYFLQIAETFIKSIDSKSTQQDIIETLNKFIEIFRVLSEPPTNTIQGLWSELFLIENSTAPERLLYYWHNSPEDKYDFDAGEEKIEVKSNSAFERVHIFSSEQLNPPQGCQVLVASIFMQRNDLGQSIQQLIESITSKIERNLELVEKLNRVVCKTLGSSLEDSIKIGFNYQTAKYSLKFYKHQDINKVEDVYIPIEVSDVKFKSDLSKVNSVNVATLMPKGNLFCSV